MGSPNLVTANQRSGRKNTSVSNGKKTYCSDEKRITPSGDTIAQRDILVSELAGIFLASKKFLKKHHGGEIYLTKHQLGILLTQNPSIFEESD